MAEVVKLESKRIKCKRVDGPGGNTSFCREQLTDKEGNTVVYVGLVPEPYMARPEFAKLWVQNRINRTA